MNIRVILADDHPFVLLGVRAALEMHAGVSIVGEAVTPSTLIDLLKNTPCDVLVTDLTMPDEAGACVDGLSLIRSIRDVCAALRIVVMTSLANPVILRAIVADGGVSVLGKMESMGELWQAIELSSRGEICIGRSIAEALLGASDEISEPEPAPRLSRNEAQVIQHVANGESIAEIAARLDCHRRTVSRLKREAMKKIGVANDPGLFSYVRSHRIDSL